MGADDYIFTALYQIDMHIDVNHLTGKNPYGVLPIWMANRDLPGCISNR
jgi:hypothetical protein|tara:strand:+ start:1462 stop:1608 length:147 start_codon:yes stop_codon:yes gene_type:complete